MTSLINLYDPFRKIEYLVRDTDRIFDLLDRSRRDVDRTELNSDGSFDVSFDVPGIKKEDLKLSWSGRTITISGKTGRRSINLQSYVPGDTDLSKATAIHENGVLKVKVPARETKQVTTNSIPIS